MRLGQRCLVLLVSDSNHQVLFDNAAKHMAIEQEREAAEHSLFGDITPRCDNFAQSLGQLLVVAHRFGLIRHCSWQTDLRGPARRSYEAVPDNLLLLVAEELPDLCTTLARSLQV